MAFPSVLTVSDHLERDEHMPAGQRERGLSRMAALVLDSVSGDMAGSTLLSVGDVVHA